MAVCPQCSKQNPGIYRFCRDCGTPLGRIAAAVRPIGATSVDYEIEVARASVSASAPSPAAAPAGRKLTPVPAAKAAAGGAKVDKCPKCNADVGGYAFCAKCGTRIPR